VANPTNYLLIVSIEAYSGKSATILGIAHQLQERGIAISYGKLLGTFISKDSKGAIEEDVRFIAATLNLGRDRVKMPLLYLNEDTILKRLQGEDSTDYSGTLKDYCQDGGSDLVLLEGAGTLAEGSLFNLSAVQIAQQLNASILLVARYSSLFLVDSLLGAKQYLGAFAGKGSPLLGVSINDIPLDKLEATQNKIKPFLEEQGIPVLGMLPRNNLLRSVSVRELAGRLGAEVLCRPDRLDLMVESLTIGAMNVNSALEYFRQGQNMAVVTGGDRTDLQMAALESSTNCLILTGHVRPQPLILSRAEDLEIPVLGVNLDTLTTVEIADRAFGNVRIQELIKVQCIQESIRQYFDTNRLINSII